MAVKLQVATIKEWYIPPDNLVRTLAALPNKILELIDLVMVGIDRIPSISRKSHHCSHCSSRPWKLVKHRTLGNPVRVMQLRNVRRQRLRVAGDVEDVEQPR